jgi:Ca-activated chloride channel family protein
MSFSRPEYLVFLWLLIPVAMLSAFGVRRKMKAIRDVDKSGAEWSIIPRIDMSKVVIKRGVQSVGIALLLLAMAGPELSNGQKPVRRKGPDVVFMLDVSNSMLAGDITPTRLARAKFEVLQISRSLADGRRALLLFAGAPVVQCPLTMDQEDFETLLDMASPDQIVSQGTVYQRAFESALRLLNSAGSAGSRETVLVLVSDGEDHGRDFGAVAGELRAKGIHLYAIGVGSGEAVPIPMPASGSQPAGMKRDSRGQVVMTRFHPDILGSLVREAGGQFYHSLPDAPVHDKVLAEINREVSASRWVMVPGYLQPMHREFIAAGLFLLFAGMALTDTARRKVIG